MLAGLALRADPPPNYYAPATGKTGADLRAALHQIVRGHRVIPYSSSTKLDTSDALKWLDRMPGDTNRVTLIYGTNTATAASFGTTAGWNREHLWCDSYGLDGVEPAYSDLHNLRAIDATVNSARGNKFYDVSATNAASYKSPAAPEAGIGSSTDTDSWEPPPTQRGDIARAVLYMSIRYTGDVSGEPRLVLTDATNLISATTNFMGRFSTLLKWHFADPVDESELRRNDEVCWLYQTNRNPFVDHPEFVAASFIPPIHIASLGTNVILTWTNDCTPTLPVAASEATSGPWRTLTNAPVLTNNLWRVTIPAPAAARFYGLTTP